MTPPVALTIAGLDPSGGAGIIADIRTFAAFGCFATAAITSLTFQNTTGVFGAVHQSASTVRAQVTPIMEDFTVSCAKTGMLPTREIIAEVARLFRAELPAHTHQPVGCLECRMTGYFGRIGLYEIMTLTPALRRLIHAEAEDGKIREQAYKEGMKPLRVSGAMKIAGGLSTADEVVKVAPLI